MNTTALYLSAFALLYVAIFMVILVRGPITGMWLDPWAARKLKKKQKKSRRHNA